MENFWKDNWRTNLLRTKHQTWTRLKTSFYEDIRSSFIRFVKHIIKYWLTYYEYWKFYSFTKMGKQANVFLNTMGRWKRTLFSSLFAWHSLYLVSGIASHASFLVKWRWPGSVSPDTCVVDICHFIRLGTMTKMLLFKKLIKLMWIWSSSQRLCFYQEYV